MASDAVARHMAVVRELSKPGGSLLKMAPTSTKKNPDWWQDNEPTLTRSSLHDRLIAEARAAFPDVEQGKRAIVLAGPPGAGKSTVLSSELGADAGKFLVVDPDEFKVLLLREAQRDGSYDSWIVPPDIRKLEEAGERFFPLELASLVHDESSDLAKSLRGDAIDVGDNIVIDTVLHDESKALALGGLLAKAEYQVSVINVEVSFALSERRIRERWETGYAAALAGNKSSLGGRWVPSEFAREVFDGPGGISKPEAVARLLAETCSAVTRYRVFRTTDKEAAQAEEDGRFATPELVVDKYRKSPDDALLDT